MNDQNNDIQIEQLTDLEPNTEVKGGTGIGALENLAGANTWARASAVTERQSGLIYSGESGGLNE